jgi:putative ABC transport system substrate-binding protein
MTDRRTFVGSIVGGFLASMMSRERPDTLLLVTDSLTNVDRKRVLDFTATRNLPAMYEYGSWASLG